MPWSKDQLILSRMQLIEKLWAQGYSSMQMMEPVNAKMRELGVPEVSVRTIKRDKARLLTRFEEETEDARAEHIEALKMVKRRAWDAYEETQSGSLNKSAYLNTIRATEESIAKLDGTYTTKITIDGQVQVQHVAMVLQKVLSARFDSGMAEEIIAEFGEQMSAMEVIDQSK